MTPPKGFVVTTAEGREFEVRGVATPEEAYAVYRQQQDGAAHVEPAAAPGRREQAFTRSGNPPRQAFSRSDRPPREPTAPEDQYDVENLRGGAIGGGAIVGGVLGAPAGPLGILVGGALGAGLGDVGFTGAKSLAKAGGIVGPGSPLGDSGTPIPMSGDFGPHLNPSVGALEEMALDLVIPAALRSVGRGVLATGKKVANVSGEAATTIVRYARELGIPIGIEAVSGRGFIAGGSRNVLGRAPWLGTAFTRSNKAVGGALYEVREKMLHEIAPFLTTMSEQGRQLSTAQLKRGKAASRMFTGKYEGLMTRAEAAGARVPTENTKEIARSIVTTWRTNMPKKIEKGVEAPMESFSTNKLVDWASDNLMKLSESMTPRQYQRLHIELNRIVAKAGLDEDLIRNATMLKKGLQDDLKMIGGGSGGKADTSFADELAAINLQYGDWKKLLGSETGKKFGRASNVAYGSEISQEGTKSADTMFNAFFNSHSPGGMRELRVLVGRKRFRSAVRTHMQDAFDGAIESGKETGHYFSIPKTRKSLGLGKPGSAEYLALKEALEAAETGVKISDLDKYFAVAEAHFKLGVIDVSAFMARRAQIGGMRTMMRALIPGLSVAGSSAGAGAGLGAISGGTVFAMGAFFAGVKGGANLMTNPRYLKAITTGLSKSSSKELQQRALARAVRLMFEHATVLDREADAAGSQEDLQQQ